MPPDAALFMVAMVVDLIHKFDTITSSSSQ